MIMMMTVTTYDVDERITIMIENMMTHDDDDYDE
jgi:hypothetical protein